MSNGVVFVFVKEPVAGAVKTRLAKEIGFGRAAALFRIMTRQTVSRVSDGPWKTVLAVDPPRALMRCDEIWPARVERIAQSRGDLGDRMRSIVKNAAPGPVVFIGADAPEVRATHIRDAFRALAGADAVIGPARDGGYWLFGLARRRAAPALFNNVRWSTRFALEDTLASLPNQFRIARLVELSDVDEAQDLKLMGPLSTR